MKGLQVRSKFHLLAAAGAFLLSSTVAANTLVGALEGEAKVADGQLNYHLPIEVPGGPHGLAPTLSVDYSPNNGNGLLGVGFQLAGLSAISRCPKTEKYDGETGAVAFDANDRYCLGGQRLIAIKGTDGGSGTEYRTAQESYARVTSHGRVGNGPAYWRVESQDGFILEYGNDRASRDNGRNNQVVAWRLYQKKDRFNNNIRYHYQTVAGITRPSAITWSTYKLSFHYTRRPDVMQAYRFGRSFTQQDVLSGIQVAVGGKLRTAYRLRYQQSGVANLSRLAGIRLCDGQGQCAPETRLHWRKEVPAKSSQVVDLLDKRTFTNYASTDLNRDGQPDLCYLDKGLYCGLSTHQGKPTYRKWTTALDAQKWRSYARAATLQFVDLNNDLLPDYCVRDDKGLYCGLNTEGKGFAAPKYWTRSFTEDHNLRFADINEDQLVDACAFVNGGLDCALNTGSQLGSVQRVANTAFTAKQGDKYNSTITLVDINGDGQSDLCGANGAGLQCQLFSRRNAQGLPVYTTAKTWGTHFGKQWKNETFTATFRWNDLNADGLADACFLSGKSYQCALNTGSKFTALRTWANAGDGSWGSAHDLSENTHTGTLSMPDLDHDGRSDLCIVDSNYQLNCGLNRNGFGKLETYANLDYVPDAVTLPNGDKNIMLYHPLKRLDVSADGIPDTCFRSFKGLSCIVSADQHHALLTGVTSGFGNTASFDYGWLTDPANHTPDTDNNPTDSLYPVNPALRVITAVSASNGIGGNNRKTFHYQGMTWDNKTRSRVFRVTRETNQTTGYTTLTERYLGGDNHGKVKRVQNWLGQRLLDEAVNGYSTLSAVDARIERFYPTQQTKRKYGLDGTLLSTITTRVEPSWLDTYGNAKRVEVKTTQPGQASHLKTTQTTYHNDTARWLLGKPLSMTATHQQGNSKIVRTTRFAYNAENGSLRQEILQPGDNLQLTNTFTYDKHGNVAQTTVADRHGQSRTSRTSYDPSGRFPVKKTNALGHSETIGYHALCGLPNKQTGPNGLSTTWAYDSLCRKTQERRADGTQTTWAYEWSDGFKTWMDWADYSVTKTTETTEGAAPVTVYADALGREVRKLTYGDNNKPILQDTRYNARGLVEAATLPYYQGKFPGDAAYWVTTEYDSLGRTLALHKPSEDKKPITTRYAYRGYTISTTDPNGNTRSVTKNALGQEVRIDEPGKSVVAHTYDAIGNLVKSSANGRVIHNHYDKLGNKTKMDDPTMGTWVYTYNAFGELTRQTDAKGQTTRMTYDRLGRMLSRTAPGEQASWAYDTADNGIGKLAQSRNGKVVRNHRYDKLGRPIQVATEIDNRTFTSQIEYDKLSRPTKETRPDGVEVIRRYDAQGRLQSIHMPKRHVWDYDYIQLQKALDEYAKRIGELHQQIMVHEERYKQYIYAAERYRRIAEYYQRYSDQAARHAQHLGRIADNLERQAAAQQRQANHYKRLSQHYWNRFGNNYFSYAGRSSGYVRYRYTERTSCARSGKRGCTRWNYYTHNISIRSNMVRNTCNWQRRGKRWICHWGPPRKLHMGRFYGDWATRYQNRANQLKASAKRYDQYAASWQRRADYYAKRAADLRQRAEAQYQMALNETKWLRVHAQKLDDYQGAADALQRQLDEHNNSDENVMLWAATSRDAAGRIQGDLAGNGQLTRRQYDPYSGRLLRITTAVGDQQPIRDLRYTYDGADNVLARQDTINGTQHSYRYDAQDRLLQADIRSSQGLRQLRYRYDIHGNLLYKSGAGDMAYDSGNRLVRRTATKGQQTTYQYDANGNLTRDTERQLQWNAFNKIQRLVAPNSDASFWYDAGRGQIKEERLTPSLKTTRYHLGQAFAFTIEDDYYGNQNHKYEHIIMAEGQRVAIHIKTLNNGKAIPDQTHYLHTDALGSVDTISDAHGQVIERQAFDPFGQRAKPQGQKQDEQPNITPEHTDRGYTGHRHLDDLGLIHMNARLYDPTLGRFLSADVYIQAPHNSQNHNRYLYVLNNPLKYTDPSGHWFWIAAIVAAVVAVVVDNPIIRMVAIIAAAAFTGGAALAALGVQGATMAAMFANATLPQLMLAGAAAGFVQGGLATGSLDGAFKGAVWGAVSAAVTFGIKTMFDPGIFRHVGQGVGQGMMAELRGGEFKSGFLGGFVGHFAGGQAMQLAGDNVGLQVVMAGLAGGLAARASGGSFEQGALAAAFAHLFNNATRRVNLLEHEGINGAHTIREHVGKSDLFLRNRMSQKVRVGMFSVYKKGHSTFTSLESANRLVSSTLATGVSARGESFASFMASDRSEVVLHQRFSAPTGRVAYREGSFSWNKPAPVGMYTGYGVTVVARKSDLMPDGFVIHTAYPTK